LRNIGRKYTTPEYQLLLTAAIEWLDTGYCIKKEEYKRREKALRESFGEMYTTHILEDPVVAQQRMAQRERAHSAGNNNKPSTPYDSFGSHVVGGISMGPPRSRSPSNSPTQSRVSSPQHTMRKQYT